MDDRSGCVTLALGPETVTIDGNIIDSDDGRWAALDLGRAVLRERSATLEAVLGRDGAPPDHHLEVPLATRLHWSARLRPRLVPGRPWQQRRVRQARFERRNESWLIAVYLDV